MLNCSVINWIPSFLLYLGLPKKSSSSKILNGFNQALLREINVINISLNMWLVFWWKSQTSQNTTHPKECECNLPKSPGWSHLTPAPCNTLAPAPWHRGAVTLTQAQLFFGQGPWKKKKAHRKTHGPRHSPWWGIRYTHLKMHSLNQLWIAA